MFLKELTDEQYLILSMAEQYWQSYWKDKAIVGWVTVQYEQPENELPEFLEFDGVKYAMLYNAGDSFDKLIVIMGWSGVSKQVYDYEEIQKLTENCDLRVSNYNGTLEVLECL